jgi:hypothetical protein
VVENGVFRSEKIKSGPGLKGEGMIRRSIALRAVAGLVILLAPSVGAAQGSKSAAVAKELVQVMGQKKLEAIAAKVPTADGHYAAAMYFANVQLLVVSGQYPVPQLMDPKLAAKEYRDIYMELSGTVTPASKVFVQDMGDPGLSQRKQDNLFDTWNQAGKAVMFDGDPDRQKMSDADYAKSFSEADETYARILGALLAEAKK